MGLLSGAIATIGAKAYKAWKHASDLAWQNRQGKNHDAWKITEKFKYMIHNPPNPPGSDNEKKYWTAYKEGMDGIKAYCHWALKQGRKPNESEQMAIDRYYLWLGVKSIHAPRYETTAVEMLPFPPSEKVMKILETREPFMKALNAAREKDAPIDIKPEHNSLVGSLTTPDGVSHTTPNETLDSEGVKGFGKMLSFGAVAIIGIFVIIKLIGK